MEEGNRRREVLLLQLKRMADVLARIAAVTPQQGRRVRGVDGFGDGAHRRASARGVVAESRIKLLKSEG